jgi:hypothetical protein
MKTRTTLTKRGKAVVATILFALFLLTLALVNVNLWTPEKCRDGILNIKNTEKCHIYRIGA